MESKRTCGGCTLCCKTHGIIEIKKPAGEWCSHCEINKGCKIYKGRPRSCKVFQCAWLMGFGMPEARPDKTQIVPEFREMDRFGVVLFLWAAADMLNSAFAVRQTRLNLEGGKPVMHMPVYGNPKLYLPESMSKEGIAFLSIGADGSAREVETVPFLEGRF
jgi:hypothetical protein